MTDSFNRNHTRRTVGTELLARVEEEIKAGLFRYETSSPDGVARLEVISRCYQAGTARCPSSEHLTLRATVWSKDDTQLIEDLGELTLEMRA